MKSNKILELPDRVEVNLCDDLLDIDQLQCREPFARWGLERRDISREGLKRKHMRWVICSDGGLPCLLLVCFDGGLEELPSAHAVQFPV